jgi:hypothetical protein
MVVVTTSTATAYSNVEGPRRPSGRLPRVHPHDDGRSGRRVQNTEICSQRDVNSIPVVSGKSVSMLAIDLFCGAGGLSSGLQAAGFDVAAHLDNRQPAVDTLNHNFCQQRAPVDVAPLTPDDVRSMVGGATPRLVAGGPPADCRRRFGLRSNLPRWSRHLAPHR